MLQHASSKCFHITTFQKIVLKTYRNYLNNITYKNETFKTNEIDKNKNHRKFNHDSHTTQQFPFHTTIPSQSQIVIAGAGIVANSVAYHLVINGWNDILILEQNRYSLFT